VAERSRDDIIAALERVTAVDRSLIGDTIAMLREDDERARRLQGNVARWHQVADLEHAEHCTDRHDCGSAVERRYVDLWRAEQ
jgi:predicted metal-dependent hydrolase